VTLTVVSCPALIQLFTTLISRRPVHPSPCRERCQLERPMPRPKVKLEDRQRAVKACLPCKASKKRCDAQQPCSNCVRRRATSFCHYVDANHIKPSRKPSQSHQPTLAGASTDESPSTTTESERPTSRRPLEEISGYVDPVPDESPGTTSRRVTSGRMLLNSKGERGILDLAGQLLPWSDCHD
jgi:hypothetical protein